MEAVIDAQVEWRIEYETSISTRLHISRSVKLLGMMSQGSGLPPANARGDYADAWFVEGTHCGDREKIKHT